jgi:GDPmannose 4,6-dehydratase
MKKTKPTAFITGITGQDGSHLAYLLLSNGYKVYGGYRKSTNKLWRLDYLGITEKITLIDFQLNEPQNVMAIIQKLKPNEFYHLAAESFIADSFKYPNLVMSINTNSTCNILEAIRIFSPNTRMFFASSSEIFGYSKSGELLNESSKFYPSNPYAISKLSSDFFIRMYREKYGIFSCSGILFNHEGPLRGGQFVSRKITNNLTRLKTKAGLPLVLGSLDVSRDWGASIDYVEAMRLMLISDNPNDYVISTGKLTTVREFLRLTSLEVGFDPIFEGENEKEFCYDKVSGLTIAKVSKKYFRPFDTNSLAGDSSKISSDLGWTRKINFEKLISLMVEADLDRWKKGVAEL